MTVFAKSSLTVKKVPLLDEKHCDEAIVQMHHHHRCITPNTFPTTRGMHAIICMAVTVFLLVLMGVITALQIFDQVKSMSPQRNHYQGYCSIPLSREAQMLDTHKSSLSWKTTPYMKRVVEPEVQVVSLLDEDPEQLMDLLREVLDIDIDDSVEKISVFNNGHPVSFIHDFESNVTGIVDSSRCFTMELDPELVLAPEVFVWGLQRGDQFDVSRVRTQLRAVLPRALPATLAEPATPAAAAEPDVPELPPTPAALALHAATNAPTTRIARALHACANKPIYQLKKDDGIAIRKRSVDAPPHDFMQFAGNRIQEIEISNLAEVLEYEQNNKQNA